MTTPRPKHHDTLAAAMKAADDKRREGLALAFGVRPEPDEPPEVVDNVGTGWGTGASGNTSPAGSLDEQMTAWIRSEYQRGAKR